MKLYLNFILLIMATTVVFANPIPKIKQIPLKKKHLHGGEISKSKMDLNNSQNIIREECESTSIYEIPFFESNSTVGNENLVGNEGGDALYEIILEETSIISIDLCSEFTNYDAYLRIYDGCPLDGGVQIFENDDGPTCDLDSAPYEPSLLDQLILEPGEYTIVVDGYGANEGQYGININYTTVMDCSGNDVSQALIGNYGDGNCDSGENGSPDFNCCDWDYDDNDCVEDCSQNIIPSIPFESTGSNFCLPDITGNPAGDFIYQLSIDELVQVDISLCSENTNFDPFLRVFEGCPLDPASSQIIFNDDGSECLVDSAYYEPSQITNLLLNAGEYTIVIDGYAESEGDFGISVTYSLFEDCNNEVFDYSEYYLYDNGQCNNGDNGDLDLNCSEWNYDGGDCNSGVGPDLVVDRDYLVNTITMDGIFVEDGDCYIQEGCVAGSGNRNIMRFGTLIGNIGSADFILGEPGGLNWIWDPCHNHYHYEEYAYYQLFTLELEEIEIGYKSGWCVMDLTTYIDPPEEGCNTYNCSYQGITAGCADIYGSYLDCQWLDVTSLEDGTYIFKVTTNPDGILFETNYHNNTASLVVSIQDYTVNVLDPIQCEEFGMFYDCSGNCMDSGYFDWLGDGICDDDGMFGVNFNCETWNFDQDDCTVLLGDVNNDGNLNVLDVVIINNLVLADQYNSSADLNSDGTINVLDIVQLVNIILGN